MSDVKLITMIGEPVTAKSTLAKELGKHLNAPVIELDNVHFEFIERNPFAGYPLLPDENGRNYFARMLMNGTMPKEKFVEWYHDAIPYLEYRMDEILECIMSLPSGTPQKVIEEKVGNVLIYTPNYLDKKFIVVNHNFIGKMRLQKQAFQTISNIVDDREKQKKMFLSRENFDGFRDSSLDLYFESFTDFICKTDLSTDFILNIVYGPDDFKRIEQIAKEIKSRETNFQKAPS